MTPTLARLLQGKVEHYLKGPIPIRQITIAGALPGRALLVWLAIRHRCDLTGKPWVTLTTGVMTEFGFDRHVRKRGLEELERVGLVRVERSDRRTPLVSLVSC